MLVTNISGLRVSLGYQRRTGTQRACIRHVFATYVGACYCGALHSVQ